jgi:hypothetical protein
MISRRENHLTERNSEQMAESGFELGKRNLLSMLYSQGQYFLYHGSSLDLGIKQQAEANREETSGMLKHLQEKAFIAIKCLTIERLDTPKKNNKDI